MRKLLAVLSGLVLVSTSVTSVVSCTKTEYYNSIWVITDGGTINDKSFNESAWDGGNMFIQGKKDDKNPGTSGLGLSNLYSSYFEASGTRISDFKMAYDSATIVGGKTLILPGFKHANTLQYASQYAKNVIYIDGGNPNPDKFKNLVGLSFASESSGFYAALAGAAYSFAYSLCGKDQDQVMMTFGGMDNLFAVDTYMIGFYIGMATWNYVMYHHFNKSLATEGNINMDWFKTLEQLVKNINGKSNPLTKTNCYLKIGQSQANSGDTGLTHKGELKLSGTAGSFFSNSFDPGKGVQISQQLVGDGAQIILPVAGPQTKDAITVLTDKHSKGRVIGVDTDQAASYNTNGSRMIITSALKNIKQATHDALQNIYQGDQSWLGTTRDSVNYPSWNGIAYAGDGMDASNSITKSDWDILSKTGGAAKDIEKYVTNLINFYNKKILGLDNKTWSGAVGVMNGSQGKNVVEQILDLQTNNKQKDNQGGH